MQKIKISLQVSKKQNMPKYITTTTLLLTFFIQELLLVLLLGKLPR